MQEESGSAKVVPALEGIRGYGFLLVFGVHYSSSWWSYGRMSARTVPLSIFSILAMAALPMFFALSGYLITNLICRTMDRPGFLRVYFWRRGLRILPVYYAAVMLAWMMAMAQGMHLHWQHLLLLLMAQNGSPVAMGLYQPSSAVQVAHLWSMSVEEQFYVLWPFVLLLLRKREHRLAVCYAGIAGVFLLRFLWPIHGVDSVLAYFLMPTRAAGILMGCALALHRQSGVTHRWRHRFIWSMLLGSTILLVVCLPSFVKVSGFPDVTNAASVRWMYSLMDVLGFAGVAAALEEGSLFQRACRWHPVCVVGRMSYALYAFHMLYLGWFDSFTTQWLFPHTRLSVAILVSRALALCLTFGLALAARYCLELPAMRLRSRVGYGERKVTAPERGLGAVYNPGGGDLAIGQGAPAM